MKHLQAEVTSLDKFERTLVPEIVEMALDPDLEFSKVAENSFLKQLKIPASYYRDASPELQTRMLKEASAGRTDEFLRVAIADTGDDILGIGPDLPPNITMSSVLKGFKGEVQDCKGSLLSGNGLCYLFFKVADIDPKMDSGRGLGVGYSVLMPNMFSKNMPLRPGILRLICTNGLIDIEKAGKEFNVTSNDLGEDYLEMVQNSIFGVAKDSHTEYQSLFEKTTSLPIVEPKSLLNEDLENKKISKTLYQKAIKIVDSLSEGIEVKDPAHPKSCKNVWEYGQLLSFVAGSMENPSARASAEISVMTSLKALAA